MKLFTIKNLQRTIIILGVFFTVNLLVVIFFPNLYLDLGIADKDILDSQEKTWAFRGQVGDILAGHFTAISMLFIVYSLLLQHKSVEQMGESITQQSKAINQQSTAIQQQSEALINQQKEIKLQTDALTAQIKEMEAQKKEFETSNIQNRFQGYFIRLDILSDSIVFTDHTGNKFKGMADGAFSSISLEKVGDEIRPMLRALTKQCRFIAGRLEKLPDTDITEELKMQFFLKLQQLDIRGMLCWYGLHLYKKKGIDAVIFELVNSADPKVFKEIEELFEKLFGNNKKHSQSLLYVMSESNYIDIVFPDLKRYLSS